MVPAFRARDDLVQLMGACLGVCVAERQNISIGDGGNKAVRSEVGQVFVPELVDEYQTRFNVTDEEHRVYRPVRLDLRTIVPQQGGQVVKAAVMSRSFSPMGIAKCRCWTY